MAELESTIQAPAPEDVWRWMPSTSGGEAWKALVGEAIAALGEAGYFADTEPETSTADLDDLPHAFADQMSVYTADRVRAVWELDLWTNVAVTDRVVEQGGAHDAIREDGSLDWDRVAALYWYAARMLTMEAVIKAARNPRSLCDRCRDRVPFDRIHYVFLNGFGSVCTECYEAIRSEEVAT